MSLIIKGKVWKFGDNVDTDELFAGRYIMLGNEADKEAYKQAVIRGAFESLSTIGAADENMPTGFIDAISRVLSGYENHNPDSLEALSGDVIVAGKNFGIGSSRQQAAEALRFLGISACLAETMHRIFYRNFWNVGGIAIDQKGISSLLAMGDMAEIDLNQYTVRNITEERQIKLDIRLPEEFTLMYEKGGLIPYHKDR